MTALRYVRGALQMEQADLAAVAAEFGTPCHTWRT